MESVVPSSRARSIGRRASRSRCYSNKESRRFISRTPSHLSSSSPSRSSLSVLRKFRRNVEPLYEIAPPAIYMRSSYGARGRLKVRECRPRVHREIGEGRGRFARVVYSRVPSLVPSPTAAVLRANALDSVRCSLRSNFLRVRARARARRKSVIPGSLRLSFSRSRRGREAGTSHRGGRKIRKAPRTSYRLRDERLEAPRKAQFPVASPDRDHARAPTSRPSPPPSPTRVLPPGGAREDKVGRVREYGDDYKSNMRP